MIALQVVWNLLLAMALGALVGLEREYARYKHKGHTYAGIRTFPLIALFGFLAALLAEAVSIWILVLAILLTGLLIIAAYYRTSEKEKKTGATSEVGGFITFFIGMFCYYSEINFAVTITVILVFVLYARSFLHNFAQKITDREMFHTLIFILIAFVVLPLLPNKWYTPLELFNPYIVWLMVVLISGIGFSGYVLIKWLGEKSIVLLGLLGGLVSSTALTLSFTENSTKQQKIYRVLALGVLLANGIMFARVLLEVFAINRLLFLELLLPLSILLAVTAAFSFFLWKKSNETKNHSKDSFQKMELQSPLRLIPALKFALFFAFMLALMKVVQAYMSNSGVYLVSLISGLADVDALTLSLSQLSLTTLPLETAKNGILIAALSNIATKGGIAYFMGGKSFGRLVLSFFLVLITLGVGLIFLI
ncbi:MgtC/SapB family protein [Candidatus Woesearchaeota archaeon]|nr:MgtC/SapB family protein [Candidatus Woesearchaeota archaeon]